MTTNGMRRLEIIIPEDHPIFALPQGSRAKIAREWLDLGARLSAIEQELRDVNKRFSSIESRNPVSQGDSMKEHANRGEHGAEQGNSVKIDDFI